MVNYYFLDYDYTNTNFFEIVIKKALYEIVLRLPTY